MASRSLRSWVPQVAQSLGDLLFGEPADGCRASQQLVDAVGADELHCACAVLAGCLEMVFVIEGVARRRYACFSPIPADVG
jgi:hypothetical protein